jgi:hypothetical protein
MCLTVLSAIVLSGCISRPSADDWLAVGYHSPEQTFRTFQTAIRGNRPEPGYRCFSDSLRDRYRLSRIAYREALEEHYPFLKHLGRAKTLSVTRLGEDRARIVAEVSLLFFHRTFAVDFVREGFWEVWTEEDLEYPLDDDYAALGEMVQEEDGSLLLRIPEVDGIENATITRVVADQYWKIDDFAEIAESPQP